MPALPSDADSRASFQHVCFVPTTEVAQFFAQETAERPSDLADAMTLVA